MENFSTNETELCQVAKTIMDVPQTKAILALQCIVGVVAVFPNLLTIMLLFRVKVFHPNLRVLLGHFSFDLMFYSATIAEKAFRRLVTPVCQLPVFFPTCVIRDWLVGIPLHNAMLALIVLLLERLYATVRFRGYENGNTRPYLAMILLVCTWISTLTIQLSNYAKASPIRVPVCETALSSTPTQLTTVIATFMSLETLAIAMMVFIVVYNRILLRYMVINRAQFDLSARFQVDQNVSVNAALLPSAILHVICYLPNYTFLLFCLIDLTSSSIYIPIETRAWLLHLSFLWRLVYACAHPFLIIALNPNLKHELFKTTCGRLFVFVKRCGNTLKTEDSLMRSVAVSNAHFSYLEKVWGSANPNA